MVTYKRVLGEGHCGWNIRFMHAASRGECAPLSHLPCADSSCIYSALRAITSRIVYAFVPRSIPYADLDVRMNDYTWQEVYEEVMAGDPKERTYYSLFYVNGTICPEQKAQRASEVRVCRVLGRKAPGFLFWVSRSGGMRSLLLPCSKLAMASCMRILDPT